MGPNLLTVDQMMAWYNAQGYKPRLNTTVADLAAARGVPLRHAAYAVGVQRVAAAARLRGYADA